MAYSAAVRGPGTRKKPKVGDLFTLTLESGRVVWGAAGVSEKPAAVGDPYTIIVYFFRGLPPEVATVSELLLDLQLTTMDAYQQGFLVPQPGRVEPFSAHPLFTLGGKCVNERFEEVEPPEHPPWGVFAWVTPLLLVDRVNVALGEYIDGVTPPPSELDLRGMRIRPDEYRRKGWWL